MRRGLWIGICLIGLAGCASERPRLRYAATDPVPRSSMLVTADAGHAIDALDIGRSPWPSVYRDVRAVEIGVYQEVYTDYQGGPAWGLGRGYGGGNYVLRRFRSVRSGAFAR